MLIALLRMLLAAASSAQVPEDDPRVISLPLLTITGTTLQSNVTYDPTREVYRYECTLTADASKVQLWIQGKTSSGRDACDTDTLTFLVP